MIPKDPVMLLSYVNTQLRDNYDSLEEFCNAQDTECETLTAALEAIGYRYEKSLNQFR